MRADAARAEAHALGLAIHHDDGLLDIGRENARRSILGVADVLARDGTLATLLTLCHLESPL